MFSSFFTASLQLRINVISKVIYTIVRPLTGQNAIASVCTERKNTPFTTRVISYLKILASCLPVLAAPSDKVSPQAADNASMNLLILQLAGSNNVVRRSSRPYRGLTMCPRSLEVASLHALARSPAVPSLLRSIVRVSTIDIYIV
jgi:hypothetical protein